MPRHNAARADEVRLQIELAKKHVGGDNGPGDRYVAELERRLEKIKAPWKNRHVVFVDRQVGVG